MPSSYWLVQTSHTQSLFRRGFHFSCGRLAPLLRHVTTFFLLRFPTEAFGLGPSWWWITCMALPPSAASDQLSTNSKSTAIFIVGKFVGSLEMKANHTEPLAVVVVPFVYNTS